MGTQIRELRLLGWAKNKSESHLLRRDRVKENSIAEQSSERQEARRRECGSGEQRGAQT